MKKLVIAAGLVVGSLFAQAGTTWSWQRVQDFKNGAQVAIGYNNFFNFDKKMFGGEC